MNSIAVTPRHSGSLSGVGRTVLPKSSRSGSLASNRPRCMAKAARKQTVIPAPSYNIPLSLGGIAAFSHVALSNDGIAGVCAVLGAFLAFQASRVKFVFDDEALEVVIGDNNAQSENKFVGGRNRWAYKTFTNWEFWWPGFPVLVYFKEVQTKPEGQIHFFPIIMDGKELYEVMSERCGSSVNSAGKEWSS